VSLCLIQQSIGSSVRIGLGSMQVLSCISSPHNTAPHITPGFFFFRARFAADDEAERHWRSEMMAGSFGKIPRPSAIE
jgi:hypothetical protein